MKNRKYLLLTGFLIITVLAVSFLAYSIAKAPQNKTIEINVTDSKPETPAKEEKPKAIPASYDLKVPYTVQAPNASWQIHEESCEEAALLMYHYFLTGKAFGNKNIIPAQTADREMRAMKTWQIRNYKNEPDLSIKALGKFARQYYGHEYKVTENITAESIKKAIAGGNPVLVPVMTHSLRNPHYGAHTTYHILVITGYDKTGVITNDAGVKEGQNWHYTWKILWQAIDAQKARGLFRI